MTAIVSSYARLITPAHELGNNGDRRAKSGVVGVGSLWLRIAEGKRRD